MDSLLISGPPAEGGVGLQQVAGAAGAAACRRSKSRVGVQVPNSFILRAGEERSQLSHLVGQRTDLAVYLGLLLLAKAPDEHGRHTVTMWPGEMAKLFGGSPYDPKWARIMRDSLSRLSDLSAIEVTRPNGAVRPPDIRLLDWDPAAPGDYQRPSSHYLKLPNAFWTNGWQAVLKSRGLAMLLISIHQHNWKNAKTEPDAPPRPFWIAPETADKLYGLHPDTRGRGWSELVDWGLLTKGQILVRDTLEPSRKRNTYRLNLSRLASPPIGLLDTSLTAENSRDPLDSRLWRPLSDPF
jgi:hypothetical protein